LGGNFPISVASRKSITALSHFSISLLSHLFPDRVLLVSESAAVAEEMLPRLGYRPACTAAPQASVVVSMSEPFLFFFVIIVHSAA